MDSGGAGRPRLRRVMFAFYSVLRSGGPAGGRVRAGGQAQPRVNCKRNLTQALRVSHPEKRRVVFNNLSQQDSGGFNIELLQTFCKFVYKKKLTHCN